MTMKKLIELDAALDALEGIDCSDGVGISTLKCDTVNDAITVIKALPTVDAVPVRHGRWIKKTILERGRRYGRKIWLLLQLLEMRKFSVWRVRRVR